MGNSEAYNAFYRDLDLIAERRSDEELIAHYRSGRSMNRLDRIDAIHILRARGEDV